MAPPRSAKEAETERNIQLALAGLKDGTYSSIGDAHKELGVSTSTLDRRVKGGKSRAEAKENQQLLTISEEEVLAAWISRATATGNPVQHSFIREMAEQLRKPRIIAKIAFTRPIGKNWVARFLDRYPHLKTMLAKTIESACVKHVTKEQVIAFYKEFYKVIETRNIKLKDIYNFDETGIPGGSVADNRLFYWHTSIIKCCYRYNTCRQALYCSAWTSRVGYIH